MESLNGIKITLSDKVQSELSEIERETLHVKSNYGEDIDIY